MVKRKIVAYRFNASTIIEVIVSMIVILVVFTIGMMIYTNVAASSLSTKKLYVQKILEREAEKSTAQFPDSSSYIEDGILIRKKIVQYKASNTLLHLQLEGFTTDSLKITEINKLIIKDDY